MRLEDLPDRVFLDTCVVNLILDFSEQIHNGAAIPDGVNERTASDIEALYNVFLVGQRAHWQLAVSPHTYQEVIGTVDARRRRSLETWFFELWQYWRDIVDADNDLPSFIDAEHRRVRLLSSNMLEVLPDLADRVLVCDAVVYNCDLFCTRDWTTILRHRNQVQGLPFDVVTPAEWWARVQPFAALFV
jgi:hypothetical protein